MNSFGYIYIRNHSSYEDENVYKIGKTHNIPDRDRQYSTGEINRGYFEIVFEFPIGKIGLVENLLKHEFKELNVKYDAGTEFYNKRIIDLIKPYLITLGIKYRQLSKQEISNLVRCNRVRDIMKKIDIQSLIHILKSYKNIWNKRDYQTTIINFCDNELLLHNKIYIELPTGGGKSYIVYNLFNSLKSDFIIIVSPRKIVNSQNISDKYLQILKENYIIFNYSIDKNFDKYLKKSNKKIVICCTQSINKIYEKISNHIKNITIWFDEAHWAVEGWINTLRDNIYSKFWLTDINIKNRIFTSASPNKSIVLQNENIFGKLYSPIKVKELINLKWLSPIKLFVYSENIQNVDNVKYIISDFNEKNRKFGFSFHNKQQNAFNLFYKHYILYKKGNTSIKPFLLISDNFTPDREPRLLEIVLEYDYRNIEIYEKTVYSIGYVVAKYSIGYNFNKLDFICFSDPKLSIQDIIQCIGRGLRPDELGQYGSNKEKILNIYLLVYIDENGNDYEKIIEVLKYLLYDIEILFEEIEFIDRYNSIEVGNESKSNEYDGTNDVKSILLNLLEVDNKRTSLGITYEKAKKIIVDNDIKSKESYYELCNRDNRLSKEPEIIFRGKFNWIDYLSIERIYYDVETCRNKVGEYLLLYPEIKRHHLDLSIVSNELCKIDELFPPNGLWIEYYDLRDLQDIITIVNKKKKIGVIL